MDRIERYRTRFTLIELLAVVALISLLMAIGVPAFSRMIRGSRVDECARNVKLALEQAQMRAASERRHVAVIFPNGGSVSSSLEPYRLGGFRTAYVTDSGAFTGWADTEWRNAPNGAILVEATASAGSIPSAGNPLTAGPADMTKNLVGAGNLKAVTGVKEIKNNDPNTRDTVDLNVGGNSAIIFTPYGGTGGTSKLYLVFSEAVVDGVNIKYPNPNTNFKVLKINELTGRVEFYE